MPDEAPLSRPLTTPAPQQQQEVQVAAPLPGARKRRLRRILMLGGLAAVLLGGAYVWLTGGRYVSTDDAYVQAPTLLVSTDVPGFVQEIDVREGDAVKAGQLLFRLDPASYRYALEGAQAALQQTALSIEAEKRSYRQTLQDIQAQQAQVDLDQAQYDRYAKLVTDNNVSRSVYDEARYRLQADQAKLAALQEQAKAELAQLGGNPDIAVEQHPDYRQAKARLDEAQRQLDHTVVQAPFDGTVTQVDQLQPGQYLAAQTAAFGLIGSDKLWVDANPKEIDLTWVKPGDTATVTVDSYPGRTWSGHVESISPASGAQFSVLPAQNTSGNWVKVVQRIPVRVVLDLQPGDPALRAGMSATVEIDTGHQRSLSELF